LPYHHTTCACTAPVVRSPSFLGGLQHRCMDRDWAFCLGSVCGTRTWQEDGGEGQCPKARWRLAGRKNQAHLPQRLPGGVGCSLLCRTSLAAGGGRCSGAMGSCEERLTLPWACFSTAWRIAAGDAACACGAQHALYIAGYCHLPASAAPCCTRLILSGYCLAVSIKRAAPVFLFSSSPAVDWWPCYQKRRKAGVKSEGAGCVSGATEAGRGEGRCVSTFFYRKKQTPTRAVASARAVARIGKLKSDSKDEQAGLQAESNILPPGHL